MSTLPLTIAANLAAIRQFCAAAGAFGGLAPRLLGQAVKDSEITPERLVVLVSEANRDANAEVRVRGDMIPPVDIKVAFVATGLRGTSLVLTYGSGRTFARLEYAIGAGASGGDVAAFSVGVYQCDDVSAPGINFASVLTSIETRRAAAEGFALPAPPAASDEDCVIERIPRVESDESFAARVLAATGVPLADIPAGDPRDVLGGQIVCRRGPDCVVTFGYATFQDRDAATLNGVGSEDGYEDGVGGIFVGPDAFRVCTTPAA